jgi:hypothetical protein
MEKNIFYAKSVYIILLGLSTTLSLVSLVSYKRQNQFVMGRLNDFKFNFIGIVCLSFTISGETVLVSERYWDVST